MVKEMTVDDLKALMDAKEDIFILDIRRDDEMQYGSIEGHKHILMEEIPEKLDSLPKDKKIIVYCHSGGRSNAIANYLAQEGFEEAYNLLGGIIAWKKYDDSVQLY